MTGCDRGDVVLINFVFSDESGAKLRPALVISSADYNHGALSAAALASRERWVCSARCHLYLTLAIAGGSASRIKARTLTAIGAA